MPNEHLVMPAHPDDWHLYHAASKTALDEGEMPSGGVARGGADRQLRQLRAARQLVEQQRRK